MSPLVCCCLAFRIHVYSDLHTTESLNCEGTTVLSFVRLNGTSCSTLLSLKALCIQPAAWPCLKVQSDRNVRGYKVRTHMIECTWAWVNALWTAAFGGSAGFRGAVLTAACGSNICSLLEGGERGESLLSPVRSPNLSSNQSTTSPPLPTRRHHPPPPSHPSPPKPSFRSLLITAIIVSPPETPITLNTASPKSFHTFTPWDLLPPKADGTPARHCGKQRFVISVSRFSLGVWNIPESVDSLSAFTKGAWWIKSIRSPRWGLCEWEICKFHPPGDCEWSFTLVRSHLWPFISLQISGSSLLSHNTAKEEGRTRAPLNSYSLVYVNGAVRVSAPV